MPAPGPKGAATRREYPNRQRRTKPRPMPTPEASVWDPLCEKIWAELNKLPHSVDFTETDWIYAEQALRLYMRFLIGGPAVLAAESRKMLDALGFTSDSRARLNIHYVDPAQLEGGSTPAAAKTATAPNRKRAATKGDVVDFRAKFTAAEAS